MSSSRHINWLIKESAGWVADGVIDANQAGAIRARYPESGGMSWGLFLLTTIGAIIFGLGIILFFAYNWSELSKYAKLALIFAALAVAHLIALVLAYKKPVNRNLIEGFHVLGTMMFGAGIWLIAQIYHIDEHYPTAFALWGAGALLLGWALPSVIQGLLASILFTSWGLMEIADFQQLHWLSLACVVVGVIGLSYYQRSRVLLFFGLVGTLTLLFGNVVNSSNEKVFFFGLFCVAVLLMAGSRLARISAFPASADVIRAVGIIIYGLLLFVLSFDFLTSEIVKQLPVDTAFNLSLVAVVLAGLAWAWLLVHTISAGVSISKLLEIVLVLIATLLVLLVLLGVFENKLSAAVLLFNAVLASHCVLLIIIGTDELKWRHVAIGCFTLAVLVFWRFNDLFQSLLMRSVVFLVLGAILFFIGHIYSKQATKSQANA